jgi:hypothetical protein
MPRIEYKYSIHEGIIPDLIREISPHVRHDYYSEIMPGKKYTVRSIYLDTTALDFYQEKLSGIKRRKKVRVRGYNEASDNSTIFLEVKRKNGPTIKKSRAAVKYRNLGNLMSEGDIIKYVSSKEGGSQQYRSANHFFYYVQKLSLIPAIKVIYEREAFFYKFDERLRITIDSNLRSSLNVSFKNLYHEENVMYAMPGKAILEIKFETEIPLWMQNILTRYNLGSQALSKYTNCLDTHSKFERQLQRSLHGLAKYNEFKYYHRNERIE